MCVSIELSSWAASNNNQVHKQMTFMNCFNLADQKKNIQDNKCSPILKQTESH